VQLFVVQKLHSSLSSDHRVVDLVQLVSELTAPGGTESEESKALEQSLGELERQWTETVDQLTVRQQVDKHLCYLWK